MCRFQLDLMLMSTVLILISLLELRIVILRRLVKVFLCFGLKNGCSFVIQTNVTENIKIGFGLKTGPFAFEIRG